MNKTILIFVHGYYATSTKNFTNLDDAIAAYKKANPLTKFITARFEYSYSPINGLPITGRF